MLLDKLAHHEAMAPNLNQTYMTPAADKNKVYFEWDFVGRTLVSGSYHNFLSLEPSRRLYIMIYDKLCCNKGANQEYRADQLLKQGSLYNVNSTLENLTKKEKETWTEATGRAGFAKMLITDQSGMLDMMTEQTYPGQTGNHPEFGEEILELARKLDEGLH